MSTGATGKIRILVVDDMVQVRQGLRTILQLCEDLEVVGEASSGAEAIRAARELAPDVVLMDLQMPEMDGLEAAQRIKGERPEIGVVIVTIHANDEIQEQVVRVGADAFIQKEAPTAHLLETVRRQGRRLIE